MSLLLAPYPDDCQYPSPHSDNCPCPSCESQEKTKGGLFDFGRRLVSKKKNRFQVDGFDLDLTYITDQLIAMGFPSQGMESTYRNPVGQVKKFFQTRHGTNYKVYNLCSERSYDPGIFDGEVANFPFDDHNCPELSLMKSLCDDISTWLNASPQNVAAIHCKAGKGRTGLVIATYLVHCGWRASAALEHFDQRRTANGKGVTIPSQQRYVHYYERLLSMHTHPGQRYAWNGAIEEKKVVIRDLSIYTLPKNISEKSVGSIYFQVFDIEGKVIISSRKAKIVTYHAAVDRIDFDCKEFENTELMNDVKFVFCCEKSGGRKQKLFQFWFHTSMLDNMIIELYKNGLDGAVKDTKHNLFQPGLKVIVTFKPKRKLRDSVCLTGSCIPDSSKTRGKSSSTSRKSSSMTETGEERRADIDMLRNSWRARVSQTPKIASSSLGKASLKSTDYWGRYATRAASSPVETLIPSGLSLGKPGVSVDQNSTHSPPVPLKKGKSRSDYGGSEKDDSNALKWNISRVRKASDRITEEEFAIEPTVELHQKVRMLQQQVNNLKVELIAAKYNSNTQSISDGTTHKRSMSKEKRDNEYIDELLEVAANFESELEETKLKHESERIVWHKTRSDFEVRLFSAVDSNPNTGYKVGEEGIVLKLEEKCRYQQSKIEELENMLRAEVYKNEKNEKKQNVAVSLTSTYPSSMVDRLSSVSSESVTLSIIDDHCQSLRNQLRRAAKFLNASNQLVRMRGSSLVSRSGSTDCSITSETKVGGGTALIQENLAKNLKQWAIVPEDTGDGGTSGGGGCEVRECSSMEIGILQANACYVFFRFVDAGVMMGEPAFIIYYWVGSDCSSSSRIAADSFAQKLSSNLQNVPRIVRILDGHETMDFLSLFAGCLRVMATNEIMLEGALNFQLKTTAMLRVYGESETTIGCREIDLTTLDTTSTATSATATSATARKNSNSDITTSATLSLQSHFCHLLFSESVMYLWAGVNTTENQIHAAVLLGEQCKGERLVECVLEGEEPDFMKEALTHIKFHSDSYELDKWNDSLSRYEAKLVRVTNDADFSLETEQVYDFSREDLFGVPVVILDTADSVFVWIATSSSIETRDLSFAIAEQYLQNEAEDSAILTHVPSSQLLGRPLIRIFEGHEPVSFTKYFPDFSNTSILDPLERALRHIERSMAGLQVTSFSHSSSPRFTSTSMDTRIKVGSVGKIDLTSIPLWGNFQKWPAEELDEEATPMDVIQQAYAGTHPQKSRRFRPSLNATPNATSAVTTSASRSATATTGGPIRGSEVEYVPVGSRFFSYADLKGRSCRLPVDKAHKEAYLNDEDFNRVFSMSKSKFYKLPFWKQNALKKEIKLF